MQRNRSAAAATLKAFDRACGLVGNQTQLGQRLGITQQAVSKIRRNLVDGRFYALSGEYAKALEEATDGAVTRLQLRRDIFG